MTARARAKPRGARPVARSRRREPFFARLKRSPLARPEVAGIVLAAVVIALVPVLIDVPAVISAVRDWFASTFGLGIFLAAAWAAGAALAWSRGWHLRPGFNRKAAGLTCLVLFAWGALGHNRAHWSLGAVDFRQVTLGGDIGRFLGGSGLIGVLAWLSLFVLGMALAAPNVTRWFVRSFPRWLREAWHRRYLQRFFEGIGSLFVVAFNRREPADEEVVIDATVAGLREPLRPAPVPTFESTPVLIRPSIEIGSPMSRVGAGAAATFAPTPIEDPAEGDDAEPEPLAAPLEETPPVQPTLRLEAPPKTTTIRPHWELPPIDMLAAPKMSASRRHDNAARGQLIVDTLASFGVDASVVEINEGPTVTQFGVEPGWEIRYRDEPLKDPSGKQLLGPDGRPRKERIEVGRTKVRVNKITALQNDLALALAAPTLRIEAPVPGRSIVGIEVPNGSASVVTLRSVMETKEYQEAAKKSKLTIALGKGVAGAPVFADLATMPHLLIAGATGSGKSVCVNSIIACIMMNATPEEARFVMIDPKRVELTQYSGMPHMAFSEVIVDMDKVVGTLQAVIAEMEARYKKFAALGVRNIEAFNRHPTTVKRLPYWVVIIDELADLMMVAPFEVEKLLCRLAQLARATGIHLVVATQRPSVDVVTGLIKANFPTRIAFAVTSMTDSRTILDMGGAEKLLGRGDMLYLPRDASKPIRIQGVYLSDAEVERLVQFWTDERFKELVPEKADDLLQEALTAQNGGEDIAVDDDDPIYERAVTLALEHQRISPSLLQRRLKIGYVKAAKLIEMLEEDGIVGPREEGESRRVIAGEASE